MEAIDNVHNINPEESYLPNTDIPSLTQQSTVPVPPPELNQKGRYSGQRTQEEQEYTEAKKSPIRFSSSNSIETESRGSNQSKTTNTPAETNTSGYIPPLPFAQAMTNQDQNGQEEKRNFIGSSNSTQFYTGSGLRAPLSKFEIKSGTVIPCTIITGINSDLPGMITAQVRQNVYDTASGRFLLIPQGTKVIGVYDSKIAYAQKRLLVVWNRLILPNGNSLNLEGMPGVDLSGYAGLRDKVNNHFGKLITGGIMTSLFGAGSKMISGPIQRTKHTGTWRHPGPRKVSPRPGRRCLKRISISNRRLRSPRGKSLMFL